MDRNPEWGMQMSGDIYMAAAGALATERKLDLIANNLAMSTPPDLNAKSGISNM